MEYRYDYQTQRRRNGDFKEDKGLVDKLGGGIKGKRRASEKDRDGAEGEVNGSGKGEGEEEEIDWEFWSLVVGDFKQVSYEQRQFPAHSSLRDLTKLLILFSLHSPKPSAEKLSQAIQKGIPPALRGELWQLMACSKSTELEQKYSDLLKQHSEHEKAIRRDLGRTFPLVGYVVDLLLWHSFSRVVLIERDARRYFKEGGGVGQENLFVI